VGKVKKMRVKSSLRKYRGIVLTIEMIFLLVAVIAFATVGFFGIGKTLISQATSSKITVSVIRAEAWTLQNGVGVTLYVQNTGSDQASITQVGIKYVDNTNTLRTCTSSVNIPLYPGEYKVISASFGSTQCPNIIGITQAYVYIIVSGNEVGVGVSVQSP